MIKTATVLAATGLLLFLAGGATAAGKDDPRFLERRGTELVLDGKPLRLVAVNKFDLFRRFLAGGKQKAEAKRAIEEAGEHGFTVIRFAGVGFFPHEMRKWPVERIYWGAFDELVATAKANGVRLVPTIYWNIYMFCEMAGECVQDLLLDADSRSRQYLWLYTYQIVTRYKGEPTILFWELTNEMNLAADLAFQSPHGRSHLNAVSCGSAYMRLRRDHFTTEQMIPFLKEWATFIRSLDDRHLIGSGFAAPRPAAQHLRLAGGKGDWTKDDQHEMERYLRDTHPDPIELISIHYYPGHGNARLGITEEKSVAPLPIIKRICDRIGKPVYFGEVGHDVPADPQRRFFQKIMDQMVTLKVPLALVWDWHGHQPERCVTPDGTQRVVALMKEANQRLARNGGIR